MLEKKDKKYCDYENYEIFHIQKQKKKYFIPHNALLQYTVFSGKSHIFPHKFYFIFEHAFNTNVIVFLSQLSKYTLRHI